MQVLCILCMHAAISFICLQVACDGGKDSLSMAASAGGETVMAPGNLVISAYVTCPDITKTVTPDLKLAGSGKLIHIDLAEGYRRLGGSSLAQVRGQDGTKRLCVCQLLSSAAHATDQIQPGLPTLPRNLSPYRQTPVLVFQFARWPGILTVQS